MDNLKADHHWKYDIDTRAGNLTLPQLPREFTATIKDNLTLQTTPVKIDGLTIVTSNGKTCGSLQFITCANMLIWSSFEAFRFTLIVDAVTRNSMSTSALQSAELCK